MATMTACSHCRTVLLPGMTSCLRCRYPVGSPARVCAECAHPNTEDSRFCSRCGHGLDEPASAAARPDPGPIAAVAADRIFVRSARTPRSLIAVFAVLGALLLAAGAIQVAESTLFSPERTVEAYFSALADRDVDGVFATMIDGDAGEWGLLTAETLGAEGYEPPSGLRVLESPDSRDVDSGSTDLESAEDFATVRVEYRLGDETVERTFHLRRNEATTAGFFHRWRIMDGIEALDVAAPSVDTVLVAGGEVALDPERGVATMAAFPGTYRVGLPEHPLWVADELAVRVGGAPTEEGDGRAVALLRLTVKNGVEAVVDQKIRAYLDGCAKAATLSPEDCPLSAYHWMEVRDVRWKIVEYPGYRLVSNDGRLLVVTETAGRAVVTGTEVSSWSGLTAPYREEVAISADGTVSAPGGEVTYTPV